MEDQTTSTIPPYIVGIQYFDNKVVEKKFLLPYVAFDTMKALGNIATRYPGSIKNLWIR